MNKGLIVIAILGVAFMYFVTNLVGTAEETTPGLENSDSRMAKEYAKYAKTDVNGDVVLDFSTIDLNRGKKMWKLSSLRSDILDLFPDFDTMKDMASSQLIDSQFKTYFLEKLNRIEGNYLDGVSDLDKAKRDLEAD